ncbi:MAG: tetratricopeptide repeat protein, partial [Bacteroidota bacterium]|nr:tetratricopeptide repeat protein [Bacteroidota bacterium]
DFFLLGNKNNDIAIDSAYFYALKSKNKEKIALTSFYKGSTHNFYSEYDTAIILLNIAIEIFSELNDTLHLAASWGEKGNAFCYRAIYDKCLDCFLKSLEYTEELDNDKYLGTVLNNIGNVYYYMENENEAIKYYKKAYIIFKKNDFYYGIALASNNVGSYYLDAKNNDSALYYFKISEKYAKEIDYFEQLAETSANMAKLFHDKKDYTKVKEYSLKSISLFRRLGSDFGLAKVYFAYGNLLFRENNFFLSQIYIDSCLTIAQNVGATEYVKKSYFLKYRLDSVAGDDKSALSNFLKYSELKDSLKSQEVEKQIANLQSVYELDKKEKENLLLKVQKSKQDITIQRQRLISIFTFVALLLFLGLLIVLYFFFRTQKKNNIELKFKNEEISQQKEEIFAQNEVLTEKNEEILRQQAVLQKQRKNTTESINYAKKIQYSSLPNLSFLNNLFNESMLIYLPKSIVSGDFYFYKKIHEQRHIIAVADCTGHGVPGALISIMNISILKEILRETPNASAAQILERARELTKLALNQYSENNL